MRMYSNYKLGYQTEFTDTNFSVVFNDAFRLAKLF